MKGLNDKVMKTRLFKYSICLGLLILGIWSCEKENLPLDESCIQVKVIDDVCGHAIMQIISPEFVSLGEDNWTDYDGNIYDGVFSTFLDCEDLEKMVGKGDVFYVRLADEPRSQNCVVCLAIPAKMPETFYNIQIAEDCADTNVR